MLSIFTLRILLFLTLALLSIAAYSVEPEMLATDAKLNKDDTPSSPLISRVAELNKITASLVFAARSGEAPASSFRIEATLYREDLRSLMIDNKNLDPDENRIPQGYLLDMVRMSALIHSASECKTGRYIVCPVALMSNLNAQQQKLTDNYLTMVATPPGIN